MVVSVSKEEKKQRNLTFFFFYTLSVLFYLKPINKYSPKYKQTIILYVARYFLCLLYISVSRSMINEHILEGTYYTMYVIYVRGFSLNFHFFY